MGNYLTSFNTLMLCNSLEYLRHSWRACTEDDNARVNRQGEKQIFYVRVGGRVRSQTEGRAWPTWRTPHYTATDNMLNPTQQEGLSWFPYSLLWFIYFLWFANEVLHKLLHFELLFRCAVLLSSTTIMADTDIEQNHNILTIMADSDIWTIMHNDA